MNYLWIIPIAIAILAAGYTWWKTKSLTAVKSVLRTALPTLRIIAEQTEHTEIDNNFVKVIEKLVGETNADDS